MHPLQISHTFKMTEGLVNKKLDSKLKKEHRIKKAKKSIASFFDNQNSLLNIADYLQETGFLTKNQIANCITETAQNTKLSFIELASKQLQKYKAIENPVFEVQAYTHYNEGSLTLTLSPGEYTFNTMTKTGNRNLDKLISNTIHFLEREGILEIASRHQGILDFEIHDAYLDYSQNKDAWLEKSVEELICKVSHYAYELYLETDKYGVISHLEEIFHRSWNKPNEEDEMLRQYILESLESMAEKESKGESNGILDDDSLCDGQAIIEFIKNSNFGLDTAIAKQTEKLLRQFSSKAQHFECFELEETPLSLAITVINIDDYQSLARSIEQAWECGEMCAITTKKSITNARDLNEISLLYKSIIEWLTMIESHSACRF